MKILVLQHIACEGLGHFEEPLMAAGYELELIKLYKNVRIPPIRGYKALIVLGGPMNVYEDDEYPWLVSEDMSIRQAVVGSIPFLGICLGAQLLAKALGSKIYPHHTKEIGFSAIRLTNSGIHDPLFHELPSEFEVFQWHGDTFDLPRGTQLLAQSEACANQAFRYKSAYGFQFHFETTPEMIREWRTLYQDDLDTLPKDIKTRVFKNLQSRSDNLKNYSKQIAGNFLQAI